MLTATLSGASQATARLDRLPAVVVAALAAKSAALAQRLSPGDGSATIEGPNIAGDRVVTVIGAGQGKAAVLSSLGAGAGAHEAMRSRAKSSALFGIAPDVMDALIGRRVARALPGPGRLPATTGQFEAELKAAAIAAFSGLMEG